MDNLRKLIEKKKKEGKNLSKNHRKAKGSVLEDLIGSMDNQGASKLKGLKTQHKKKDPSDGLDKPSVLSDAGEHPDMAEESGMEHNQGDQTNQDMDDGEGISHPVSYSEQANDGELDNDVDDSEVSKLRAEVNRLKSLLDKPKY